MSEAIKNRYEFTVLFDVENGNPNGDPDAGNMPRVDQETNHGLVTDVCLKRKIRNYVEAAFGKDKGCRIYIKENVPLERSNNEALEYYKVNPNDKNLKKNDPDIEVKLRNFMCENFFDIRTFGAVMTTFTKGSLNCGQVRGPVQLGFAKSIDPIMPQEITVTRLVGATENDPPHTMGRKFIVPYALYRVDGYISANFAKVTGFSEDDLEKLWNAIINMFELDHSAARGKMSVRRLLVYKHDNPLGNAPAYKLFDLIKICKKDEDIVPRSYDDYEISINKSDCPKGVTLCEVFADELVGANGVVIKELA
ncbi:MAG: type I-C CRISPR-associated protein Cas7/Csd2 [Selenomonadaceae bacterium]|nr:type I-C CRISPR-associated protein Cas7/Csd2 [Selenomonadaceae bacterium]